jgi:polyisoprenoid-binding protein YceI
MNQLSLRSAVLSAGALCLTLGAAMAQAAESAAAPPHYSLDAGKSTLEFSFTQAGAQNKGHFGSFPVTFDFAPENPANAHLDVVVQMSSIDSGDQERDDTLKSPDLFSTAKYPQAHYVATQVVRTAAGYEAVGKLTLRGVTRDLRVPFTFRTATENGTAVGYMSGKTSIKRLDYGVGQGDWRATDQVGNDVGVSFALRLTAAH